MLNEFILVLISEIVTPVLQGYFAPAETRAIGRWRWGAWGWLGGSLAAFLVAFQMTHPVGMGVAAAGGMVALLLSVLSSASASVLLRESLEDRAKPPQREPPVPWWRRTEGRVGVDQPHRATDGKET